MLNGQQETLPLVIVSGAGPSLLAVEAMIGLGSHP